MKGLLFTLGLTYGGALASLFNPYWGLLAYITLANLRPESLWFWSVPHGNYSRIIAIALLVGWGLNGFGRWNLGRAWPIVILLLGFYGWAVFSTMTCAQFDVGMRFLESKGKIVLPFVIGVTLINSVAQIRQLAWVIVLSQGYVALTLNESYYRGFNRLQEIGFGYMDNNSQAIAMVTGVGLAFFLGTSETERWKAGVALVCSALMAHCVFFSFSRGGMLALCVAGFASFVVMKKRPVHFVLFVVAALIAVRMAGPEVRERFATAFAESVDGKTDGSAQSRLRFWGACVDMMLEDPITGVGPDHFPRQTQRLGLGNNRDAHSTWLQTGAELGLPGLVFFGGFFAYPLALFGMISLRPQIQTEDPFLEQLPRMVVASLTGFFVGAQFVTMEGLEIGYYVVLLGAGYLKVVTQMYPAQVIRSQPIVNLAAPRGNQFATGT